MSTDHTITNWVRQCLLTLICPDFYHRCGLIILCLFSLLVFVSPAAAIDIPNASLYAQREWSFIKAITDAYLHPGANFEPAYQFSLNNADLNAYYRNICTHVITDTIIRGQQSLSPTNEHVLRMTNHFVSDFQTIDNALEDRHVIGAPYLDCLIAVNLARAVIPSGTLGPILEKLSIGAQSMAQDFTVEGYRNQARGNAGDTPAEEAGLMASYLLAASKLLPSSGRGAIDLGVRGDLFQKAKDLIAYSYTQCADSCPFKSGTWLVANHQTRPNPTYTQSLLTSVGEWTSLYNQLGEPLPAEIFSDAMRSAVRNISTALSTYTSPHFTYQGPFDIISYNGTVTASSIFENNAYTITGDDTKHPINSSIPIDRIDSLNQFVLRAGDASDTTTIKSYVYRGGRQWHYTCDFATNPVECKAEFQRLSLQEQWDGIANQAGANVNWNVYPPPDDWIDALSQWYFPGTTQLKSYVWKGDRVWHYICSPTCTAQYTQPISQSWPTVDRDVAGWTANPPPSENHPDPNMRQVDAISQFTTPGTTQLDSYILRGNQMWAYRCTGFGTAQFNCFARYTKELTPFWAQVGGDWAAAGWTTTPPPGTSVDSFYQYYYNSPTGWKLNSFIIKGATVWKYECPLGGTCSPKYVTSLKDFFDDIFYQFKWLRDPADGFIQRRGVADFGYDATFQNNSYAAIAVLVPDHQGKYNALQEEQLLRGRNTNPPFPARYENGAWSWGQFITSYGTYNHGYLQDGWRQPDPATGKFYPLSVWQPLTIDTRVNAHWWTNMLVAYNHAIAYLLMTNDRLLRQFGTDPIVPTNTPTATPTPIPGDLNNDRKVNVTDLFASLAQSPLSIFTYTLVVGNYGKTQ